MKGTKVDSYFYPQTKPEHKDMQVFFKESMETLKAWLGLAVQEKKGVKCNLVLCCKMTIPSKYQDKPLEFSPYFRLGPYTSTYPEELEKQLHIAYEMLEDQADRISSLGSGWVLERNNSLILDMVD